MEDVIVRDMMMASKQLERGKDSIEAKTTHSSHDT